MKSILVYNSDILNMLKEAKITQLEGLSYLTLLYYNMRPSFIPADLEKKILSLGIVNMDYTTKTILWKIPLFEEGEKEWDWIKDWMDEFGKRNKDRRGIKVDVLRRMKKFFANNPSVRKEDIIKATELYFKSVTDYQYLKKAHKFIYEQDNSSMLKEYVDKVKEENIVEDSYNGLI